MTVLLRAAVLSSLFAVSPAFAAGECLVDDPTGTPLNVRAEPNGPILTTLPNGTSIAVAEERKLGTKRWLLVSRQGERLGWIFAAYVVCPKAGGVVGAAPGQPAEQR
jgi:uncharacterized protein YraI